jgi:hypothetical protein
MDQLHANALAPSQRAAQCFVWSFFIGVHTGSLEIGKGKEIGRKSE